MISLGLRYSYNYRDEQDIEPLIAKIEKEFGGVRAPYDRSYGAIDIVALVTITATFLTASAFQVLVDKYFEGFLNAEGVVKLGEKHRQQIERWFSEVKKEVELASNSLEPLRNSHTIGVLGNEEATLLAMPLGDKVLYVVLNHVACTPEILSNLPQGLINALRLAVENQLPEDSNLLQLYFDKTSKHWKFLFAPKMETYGRWIDRYVNLETRKVHTLKSRKEFLEIFRPDSKDEFKFLLSPFRKD